MSVISLQSDSKLIFFVIFLLKQLLIGRVSISVYNRKVIIHTSYGLHGYYIFQFNFENFCFPLDFNPGSYGVRVTLSLVVCVCFACPFSLGYCVVCPPSISGL